MKPPAAMRIVAMHREVRTAQLAIRLQIKLDQPPLRVADD